MSSTPRPSRFDEFLQYHHDNPRIFRLFVKFAKRAKTAGRSRFGARAIGERVRWYVNVDTESDDGMKINDHHWPYYSRLAMARHPRLAGLFSVRPGRFDTDVVTLDRLAD